MARHLTISGEIGSGKTSVASLLALATGRHVISAGQILRQMAASRGVTALEANRIAERDASVDAQIDATLRALGQSSSGSVYDSRIAWHLIPSTFKVHLIVDPDVAASRLLAGRISAIEVYRSAEDAKQSAEARYQSERRRFYSIYRMDISRLSNYDLVLDTSDAAPELVAQEILSVWKARGASTYPLRISPLRVQQLHEEHAARSSSATASNDLYPSIIYSRPNLFTKHVECLATAISRGNYLMPAALEAEDVDAPILAL